MRILIAAATAALLCTPALAAGKTYQVTGPVLALTDKTITIGKGQEKWELNRDTANIPADVKVGSKVTAQYTMSVVSIEDKSAKAEKPAAAGHAAKEANSMKPAAGKAAAADSKSKAAQ